jgi:hypothetical protein
MQYLYQNLLLAPLISTVCGFSCDMTRQGSHQRKLGELIHYVMASLRLGFYFGVKCSCVIIEKFFETIQG